MNEKGKALIAMSGGVDSSVAAACMQAEGYTCIGITMKLYDNADIGMSESKTCCSLDDTMDARRVCERLGMAFYVNNFRENFETCVIDRFVDAYRQGITPNPCIECNRHLKFERLYRRAEELGCEVIVTGHYVRNVFNSDTGYYELRKGADPKKDQSYVLYMLSQEKLAHSRFPIGEMCKEETRRIAEEHGFVNAHKSDSQDICFIPDGDYQRFLKEHGVLCKPGSFVDEEGNVLGEHTGICNYTCGQRKGLGISAPAPYYVKEIRPASNEVVLSDNASLFETELDAADISWTLGAEGLIRYTSDDSLAAFGDADPGSMEKDNFGGLCGSAEENVRRYVENGSVKPGYTFRCQARIRYHHREAEASVTVTEYGFRLTFDEPQRAITPGQAAVLYLGDIVLGGGTIVRREQYDR